MSVKRFLLSAAFVISWIRPALAEVPERYFDAGDPIEFCNDTFYFAWSAHPRDIYYLQEYLPEGESFDSYTRMFTVGVIFWDRTPAEAVRAKIAELENCKRTDPVCRYLVAEKDGEYILDFIVGDGRNGVLDLVEADVHYYRQVTVDGKKASLLCFYSCRAYGEDILPFMKTIPDLRNEWYRGMSELDIVPKFVK